MKKIIFTITIISSISYSKSLVNISNNLEYIDVNVSGKKMRIHRINDTSYKLSDDFTKTSRICPPFCIQPIRPVKGVKNIEELELIDFIKTKISSHKGLLIDARTRDWYNIETIPGAINIPFTITQTNDKKIIDKLFKLLGVKIDKNGNYNFSNAKDLALFCNGLWCAQSPTFIRNIVKYGYPKDKIYYYRSGMQGWKLLGLTTQIHKVKEVK